MCLCPALFIMTLTKLLSWCNKAPCFYKRSQQFDLLTCFQIIARLIRHLLIFCINEKRLLMISKKAPGEDLSSIGLGQVQYAEIEKEADSAEDKLVRCRLQSDNSIISWPKLHYIVVEEVFADYSTERLQFIIQEGGAVVGVRSENLALLDWNSENVNPDFVCCGKSDDAEIYCIRTDDNSPHSLSFQYLQEVLEEIYLPYNKAALVPYVCHVMAYVWDEPTHSK